jgi:hypothetical protein
MLPVCDSIFLSRDDKESRGSAGQICIIADLNADTLRAQGSCLERMSGRQDSLNSDPSFASRDMALQTRGSPVLSSSSNLLHMGLSDSVLQLDEMPPDYDLRYYNPIDHYIPQQSTETK